VAAGPQSLEESCEERLWPPVEEFCAAHPVAGVAVAVVRDQEVAWRGFGVRDVGTREPVTPQTMFHLASVSEPFVATAVVSLAMGVPDAPRDGAVDAAHTFLGTPIIRWVPEFTLADGRHEEVTVRGLLSHTSGLPDVSDYGWHDPQLGDEALSDFARSLSGWRLQSEPGAELSYSNAGYELLGLVLSRATGTTFEEAVKNLVLAPLGMQLSTFLRAEVPASLTASPHVSMPLEVPEGHYPYTRRHAPSSTLHSNLVEMCRWMRAHFDPAALDPAMLHLMWRPAMHVGEPPWEEDEGLGWEVGHYGGYRTLSHSGADPGFGCRFALVPERRIGAVVLANSNTVATGPICRVALDVALDIPSSADDGGTGTAPGQPGEGAAALRALLPPVAGPVAETLRTSGPDAAMAVWERLAAAAPARFDLSDEGFEDAVWGAIELHRTALVWPLLRLWTAVRPDSATGFTLAGWAHQVDADLEEAGVLLRRALELDPGNKDAALILANMPSA
jgi:CubicO group peptidase (beta-lactamase class C family)